MKTVNIDFSKIDREEVLRYAASKSEEGISSLLDECIKEVEGKLNNTVVYDDIYIDIDGDDIDLTFSKVKSKGLAKNLNGCKVCVVFCATLGIEMDRLIEKYSKVSPSKALILNAIGTERIENLCDNFAKYIANEYAKLGLLTKSRFSPGYSDLSLDVQKDIISFLEAQKRIGITLNESLLMSPSKSVSAFIGLQDIFSMFEVEEQDCTEDCSSCNAKDCQFKK